MSAVTANLTPAIVAACARAEAESGAAYVMARSLITPFSARYLDRDDVASLARVILADVINHGYAGSDAAWLAVSRAAAWIGKERTGEDRPGRAKVAAIPVGDTRELLELESDSTYAPDRIARWSVADTLGAVWERMPSAEAEDILAAMAHADAWHADDVTSNDDGSRRVRVKQNVAGIGRVMTGSKIAGRAYSAFRTAHADAVTAARNIAADLPRECLPTMPTGGTARGLVRDSTIPTSGTASAVVRTVRSGRWITLADRSVMVDDDGAAYVLSQTDTVSAYDKGTVREITAADLGAPRDLLPARRPSGVGVGMVHGYGARAGGGAPEPRPTMSRRRKRDGGIGSPMVPA